MDLRWVNMVPVPRLAEWTAAGLAAALLLAGCSKDEATPPAASTTSAPVMSVTPSAGKTTAKASTAPASSAPVITARPTTKAEEEALAKEAEQVYLKSAKAQLALMTPGKLPEDVAQYLMGDELSSVSQAQKYFHDEGLRFQNTSRIKMHVKKHYIEDLEPDSLIGLVICSDGSRALSIDRSGKETPGSITVANAEFKRHDDGRLRIHYSVTEEEPKCAL